MASDKEKDRSLDGGSSSSSASAAASAASKGASAAESASKAGSTAASASKSDTASKSGSDSSYAGAKESGDAKSSKDATSSKSGGESKTSGSGSKESTSSGLASADTTGASLGSLGASIGGGLSSGSQAASTSSAGLKGGMVSSSDKEKDRSLSASYDRDKAIAETGEAAREAQMAGLADGIGAGLGKGLQQSTDKAVTSSIGGTPQDAALASQARAAEIKSMEDMNKWGLEVKSVVAAGPGWTTVALNNGKVETRAGDRASRNNNPGNLEASSWTKSQPGYVDTDGRFAVFSTEEDGLNAVTALLGTSRYSSQTVAGAIGTYAPAFENDTDAYAAAVASKIGVSPDTPMSDLSDEQRSTMVDAIMGVEGNTGFETSTISGAKAGYGSSSGAASTGDTQASPSQTTNASSPPSYDEARFSSQYLGGTIQGGIEDSANKYDRQIAQETSFFGEPVTHVDRGVQPNLPSTKPATKSNPNPTTVPPSSSATTVSPTTTATPVPPSSSAQPVKASTTTETVKPSDPTSVVYGTDPKSMEGDFPERPRTTGETIAAIGVDAALGMLPGIGMGISLVNGGLALTGNRTLGERVVDAVATGGGGGSPPESDPNRPDYLPAEAPTEEADEEADLSSVSTYDFAGRYLTGENPTPAQKWGSTYGL